MKHLALIVLFIGLSLRLVSRDIAPGDTEIGFEPAIMELLKALGAAERVEVYEGLPNPVGEREVFESQRRAKDCRQIAGEWFYAKPQEARLGDVLELQRLAAGSFFQPWRGFKFCGGFHADFAFALTSGKKTLYVLFCFGCHEARIISETQPFAADLNSVDFRLTTDLKKDFFDPWRARLTTYRKERPAPNFAPSGR